MALPELAFQFRKDNASGVARDRRQSPRLHVVQAAKVVLNNGWTTLDANITDLNETGGKLSLAMAAELPESFLLVIVNENVIVPVRCVWRREHEAGVEFAGERRPATSAGM